MGSLSGILQRPLTAVAALALATFSSDLPDKLATPKSPDHALQQETKSWASQISVSKLPYLSFATRFHIPLPNTNYLAPTSHLSFTNNSLFNSFTSPLLSSPALLTPYQSARLATAPKFTECKPSPSSSPPEVMYKWHLPDPNAHKNSTNSDCSSAKSKTVVVLLGWLGAKQKHLKRYADWYTSNGFHVISFTFPMAEILSYQVGGKAEEHVDLLVNHLAGWLEEEHGKNLVFHTFSNTGWLTYGVVLEKFQKQDPCLMSRIRGCVVDSAPVAAPDPRVWASGFSAAFLKKHSVATKSAFTNASGIDVVAGTKTTMEHSRAATEAALLVILEKFFQVVLNLPKVNRRLSDVLDLLSSNQPKCPQLYIYSSADRVIPAESVETFIEKQRKAGLDVRACNFVSTPHVDHFRNDPNLYISEITNFLQDSVLTCCKNSSP